VRRALAVVTLCAALAAPAGVLAAQSGSAATQPKTTLPDVEDEVMCTICGTALNLSDSPQADRERAYIRRQIARGKTKGEIKDALVRQYGPNVLAEPEASGFDLTAWIVPGAGIALVAIALGFAVVRWRRSGGGGSGPGASPLDPEDERRLDSDLARYDL
jgi:cytochrome c-type biogenesis protein CcmH